MIWTADYVLILKGSESTNPADAGDEIALAIRGVRARVRLVGDVQVGGDGSLFGRTDKHIELVVFPKPFTVLPGADTRMQSHGSLWYLTYNVLAHTYVHVLGAYTSLSASTGLPDSDLPRSVIDSDHETSPTYSDEFWLNVLPLVTVLDGDVSVSENHEQGTDEISSFTLVRSTPEDPL